MARNQNRKKEQRRPRSRRHRLSHLPNLDHKASSSHAGSQPSTSTFRTQLDKFTKPSGDPKIQGRLPLNRPGFVICHRVDLLSDLNLINLAKCLGLASFRAKHRPRLDALLLETFRTAYDIRDRYPVMDSPYDVRIAFFTDVTNSIKATGINGGDFLYHRKLEPECNPNGTKNPGDLSLLTPDAVMGLFRTYVHARKEFKDRQAGKEQQLVLRRKGESTTGAPHDDHDDSDNDEHNNDIELVVEEVEEEGLFVPSDSDEEKPRMTKKEKRLVRLVDQWIEWLEQEQGNAVDPSLMKGLSM